MELLILLVMGAIAGTLAGLLGIGGGIIIVPVLALFYANQGISADVLMHVAIGTSLATIVITSLSSIRTHQQHNAINWPVFRQITPGILLGAFLGAIVARYISGHDLRLIFGIFMLFVAAQMIFGNTTKPHRHLPKTPGMLVAGTAIGLMSSLMGVGGGSMSVPFLTWCNVAIRNAVATSAAIGLPIAVAGTFGFIVTGWSMEHRPVMSLGYVNIPAFFSIVVASTLFAPVGARITHRIPPQRLRQFFGLFLLILSIKVLYR
ncbi:MAG: sulfite exporter TauE/SafE family protein [Acidiferrobacterales bacterium]|nr:sulfite exporter TauE/SafE family protein [Acidiferrobacterales bacterium]